MSDFDTELRQRLQRLEAAVPESSAPVRNGYPQRRTPRRGQVVLALTAVLALVIGTALVASGTAPPPDPAQLARDAANEERVNDDLLPYFEDACLAEAEARTLVRERLDALDLTDWTIRLDRASLGEAPCVGAGALGHSHEVMLHPSMGGAVNDALEALKVELLRQCLGPTEAIELLRRTLESAGISEPRIAIGGIRGVPGPGPDSDESKAYLQHVADGCVVFGDAQSDQNGRYTWALTSR